jgi:hypothetical protein
VPLKKTNQLAAFSRPAPLARNEPGGEQLYARLILRQMRAMKATFPKPRHSRLPKEARALKSIVAEARALGLVPPEPPAAPRRRR